MDRNEVHRELAREYARCLDDRCFEELDGVMSQEVVVAAPDFECQGLAAFREKLRMLSLFSNTMHLVANQRGAWDGDKYSGETYCIATHVYEQDGVGRKWEVGIRYKDEIGLVDGAYRFTRRYLDVQWQSDVALQDLQLKPGG